MNTLSNEKNLYSNIENDLNVVYPENQNATYISLVNYSDDLQKPFQRWYRYKEGFSIDLVKNLIKQNSLNDEGTILDPFSGSGSTLLAAKELGYNSVGFEVNPFSYFLSKVKLQQYSANEVEEFKRLYEKVISSETEEYPLPELSFSDKVFTDVVRKKLMTVKHNIIGLEKESNAKVIELLKLGWMACIEELSEYRKAGNGLKRRKLKKPIILSEEDVYYKLDYQYSIMYKDLLLKQAERHEATLINDSCLNVENYLEPNSITGVIFSPPYANCFDYTEIYKLELWFGDFVKSYPDLKELRNISLRSHLSSNLKEEVADFYSIPELELIVNELQQKELWDKRIPNMIKFYFHDMFRLIEKCYEALEENGFCNIVVSNSAYGGVIVPTDILFAKFAETIGFKVEGIDVARYIITSSQQYEITKKYKNLLRESVVCLRK